VSGYRRSHVGYPPWSIRTAACSIVSSGDAVRVRGHAFAHDRVVAEPTREGAHQIPLGHDPGESPTFEHEDRSDVAVRHR
jgi:hypothetical protein